MRRCDQARGALVDSHPTVVLGVLEDAEQPVHIEEVAERLVKQDETVMSAEAFEKSVERTLISLHHNVLPRLADNGILTYDHASNMVSVRDTEQSNIDWFHGDTIGEILSDLDTDGSTDRGAIGVINGRHAIIEHGRHLADAAQEELFCLYVSTDLLEDECLGRAKTAIDRGVDLYMGSRNPAVRDLTRTHLPEATIWEPHRGWLNAPVGYPKVGRLILADREKVMLAVLDAPNSEEEFPEEQAMVGEGEANPLVVLVRELLGPRLDHLDHQSTDFHTKLQSCQ